MQSKRLTVLATCFMLALSICSNANPSPSAIGSSEALTVDADFPGGNIIVDHIEGDTVFLKPDLRDTSTWWFYWHFCVRGAAGRTIKFQFVDRSPIGTRGPAFSKDGGKTWSWLDPKAERDSSFTYEFGERDRDVQFCFSIPYLEANLQQFIRKHDDDPHLHVRELCRSRRGRPVKRLHVGKIHGDPRYRILITARHHACEMIASYSLEGLLESVLSDTNWTKRLRRLTATINCIC